MTANIAASLAARIDQNDGALGNLTARERHIIERLLPHPRTDNPDETERTGKNDE
jgi:hypothetical protein